MCRHFFVCQKSCWDATVQWGLRARLFRKMESRSPNVFFHNHVQGKEQHMQLKSNILRLNYQIQQFIRTFCPYMHWPMFSARGRQSAVFWETPMRMNVCCTCRKRLDIGLAHRGACIGSYTEIINTTVPPSMHFCVENQFHSPCWSSPEGPVFIVFWTGSCSWVMWGSPTPLVLHPSAASATVKGPN